MSNKKPSKIKIRRYAILKILDESNEPRIFDDLVEYSGFEPRRIVGTLNELVTTHKIKKNKTNRTRYTITTHGRKAVKFLEENTNIKDYWTAPWE